MEWSARAEELRRGGSTAGVSSSEFTRGGGAFCGVGWRNWQKREGKRRRGFSWF
jgi:hypothetical protein